MAPGKSDLHDRGRGCLLGLAVGDAVGTAMEFSPRGSFAPLTDLVGGGPFRLAPGQWTDDTSMALCLGVSLAECGGFDPRDQMERYCRWREEGYLSSTGRCFDVGGTVAHALATFRATGQPFAGSRDPRSAGNGCIMRLAPIPLFYFPDETAIAQYARESSRTTHGAAECLDACQWLALAIARALAGRPKEEVLSGDPHSYDSAKIQAIRDGAWRGKSREQIRGSGYVVECLEAAVWCFASTESFPAAVLAAANLGDDADTTAAVCGQLAGAYYGASGIPAEWLGKLAMGEFIEQLADRLLAAGPSPCEPTP